jgi:hypothetical protein
MEVVIVALYSGVVSLFVLTTYVWLCRFAFALMSHAFLSAQLCLAKTIIPSLSPPEFLFEAL